MRGPVEDVILEGGRGANNDGGWWLGVGPDGELHAMPCCCRCWKRLLIQQRVVRILNKCLHVNSQGHNHGWAPFQTTAIARVKLSFN